MRNRPGQQEFFFICHGSVRVLTLKVALFFLSVSFFFFVKMQLSSLKGEIYE